MARLIVALALVAVAAACGTVPDATVSTDVVATAPPSIPNTEVVATVPPSTPSAMLPSSEALEAVVGEVPFVSAADGSLQMLDVPTGTVRLLWMPSDSRDEQAGPWAISPDGARAAYVRTPGYEVAIGRLEADDAPPTAAFRQPTDTTIPDILWEPGGEAVLVAYSHYAPPSREYIAAPESWVLRRLAVGDDDAVLSDDVLLDLDAEELDGDFAELAALDPLTDRAVVLGGPGSNGHISTIWILDTESGAQVARFATGDEGYQSRGSPDGRWVAVADYPQGDSGPQHVRLVDVRGARMIDLGATSSGRARDFVWSDDSQWLVWSVYKDRQSHVNGARITETGVEPVEIAEGVGAHGLAFVPSTPVLIAGDRLIDLASGAARPFPAVRAQSGARGPWFCESCPTGEPR